jgi:hypothetical protein
VFRLPPGLYPASSSSSVQPYLFSSSASSSSSSSVQPYPQRPGAPLCLLFVTRGMCLAGANCPCDHPRAGE